MTFSINRKSATQNLQTATIGQLTTKRKESIQHASTYSVNFDDLEQKDKTKQKDASIQQQQNAINVIENPNLSISNCLNTLASKSKSKITGARIDESE